MAHKQRFIRRLSMSPVPNFGKTTRSPQSDLTPWILTLGNQDLASHQSSEFDGHQHLFHLVRIGSLGLGNGEKNFDAGISTQFRESLRLESVCAINKKDFDLLRKRNELLHFSIFLSHSAHPTPNFMNPEYFVFFLFEYFFRQKF